METEIKNQNGNRNENRKLQIQTRGLRGAEVDLLRNSLQQMVNGLWDVLREEETAKVGTRTEGLEHLMSREELQKLQCFQAVSDPDAAKDDKTLHLH